MIETAAVADSTPATVVMDVARGPLVDMTPEQRTEFRKTGEIPAPKKQEESAPSSEASPSKGEAESAGESETPSTQEHTETKPQGKPKLTADGRIEQLEAQSKAIQATIDKIRKGAGIKTEAESSPAKPEPKPVQQQTQATRPKPTADDKNQDGTSKFATYEDFVEDLADWKAEQRWATQQREQAAQAEAKAFNAKVEEARGRYENFEEVVQPAATAINGDASVPSVVKQMLNDSDVLPDLLFTLGSDDAELAKFVKMAKDSPGKAIRYIALTESLIADELANKAAKPATEEAPVKPKTQAPRPPSEAGGRAATPPDAEVAAIASGDYRAAKAEMTRKALAKLKG